MLFLLSFSPSLTITHVEDYMASLSIIFDGFSEHENMPLTVAQQNLFNQMIAGFTMICACKMPLSSEIYTPRYFFDGKDEFSQELLRRIRNSVGQIMYVRFKDQKVEIELRFGFIDGPDTSFFSIHPNGCLYSHHSQKRSS